MAARFQAWRRGAGLDVSRPSTLHRGTHRDVGLPQEALPVPSFGIARAEGHPAAQ